MFVPCLHPSLNSASKWATCRDKYECCLTTFISHLILSLVSPCHRCKMSQEAFDAVVIGAGFAGIFQLKRLRDDLGLKCLVRIENESRQLISHHDCCYMEQRGHKY